MVSPLRGRGGVVGCAQGWKKKRKMRIMEHVTALFSLLPNAFSSFILPSPLYLSQTDVLFLFRFSCLSYFFLPISLSFFLSLLLCPFFHCLLSVKCAYFPFGKAPWYSTSAHLRTHTLLQWERWKEVCEKIIKQNVFHLNISTLRCRRPKQTIKDPHESHSFGVA